MHDSHRLLRQATATCHERLDALLGSGLASTSDYAAYLRGMEGFLADAGEVLGADAMTEHMLAWLRADLAFVGLVPSAPRLPATTEPQDGPARLGWEYVVAGSALGARLLLRDVRALGLDADGGASFLAGHAESAEWQRFLRALGEPHVAVAMDQVCEGAIEAFRAAERRMRAAREEMA